MANLLFLCDTFPPHLGGSERILAELARGAKAQGHQVLVLTPASDLEPALQDRFDSGEPYAIVRSSTWRRLFRMGGSKSALTSRLARAGIIIHVFSIVRRYSDTDLVVVGHPLPLGNVAQALHRLRGTPYVLITYGEDVTMYSRGARTRGMLRSALASAAAVTCLTSESAAELARLEPSTAGKTFVIPPPASLQPEDPKRTKILRQELQLEDSQVLLTVARVVPRKGIDVTLQAVAALAPEFPRLRYLVVGDGPDLPRVRQLADSLGITERVVFAGPHDPPDSFYYLCDLFCMPNRTMPDGEREGFGIVFAEAGLAGKPCIAGRSGGAPDAVANGESGFVVDPEDPAAVASAIRRILSDRHLARRMGEAGRKRALLLTSPAGIRAQFQTVIQAALSRPQPTALGR